MREIDKAMMNKFNMVDRLMYKLDGLISEIKTAVSDIKEQKQADPEQIIEEAIKPLQEENQKLKERDFPIKIIIKDNKYLCPGCGSDLKKSDVGFFCRKCGQKISANLPE